MSGERVDVLQALRDNAVWAEQVAERGGVPQRVREAAAGVSYRQGLAIDAVAELIEADRKVDEVEAAIRAISLAGPRPHSYGTGWELRDAVHRCELDGELEAAHKRRAAALSRIQPDGQGE